MIQRAIAGVSFPAIGLGCMNLSHAYGAPPEEAQAAKVLLRAFELGIRHFDSAALYGFGRNETLLGKVMKHHRHEIHVASKCGMTGVDGKRVIDGRPETLAVTLEESLRRLQTDHIDLYYLHRWDRTVPIEDSIGAMSRMVEQGKVGALGLSEVSATTLRKAHAVHPIAALQTEYSLWTRNPEIAVLDVCRELDIAFVAFSPLGRGFLTNQAPNPAEFVQGDIRSGMPRFQSPHYDTNMERHHHLAELSTAAGCSVAQLALAWLMAQGDHIVPIPGTTSSAHLEENVATMSLNLEPALLNQAGALINQQTISGARYPDVVQREIDTEDFAARGGA